MNRHNEVEVGTYLIVVAAYLFYIRVFTLYETFDRPEKCVLLAVVMNRLDEGAESFEVLGSRRWVEQMDLRNMNMITRTYSRHVPLAIGHRHLPGCIRDGVAAWSSTSPCGFGSESRLDRS